MTNKRLGASQSISLREGRVKKHIRNQNIDQFRWLLRNNPDDVEREVLESLLAEEEAKADMQERVESIVSQLNAGLCANTHGHLQPLPE
jgi:hypothetical protein